MRGPLGTPRPAATHRASIARLRLVQGDLDMTTIAYLPSLGTTALPKSESADQTAPIGQEIRSQYFDPVEDAYLALGAVLDQALPSQPSRLDTPKDVEPPAPPAATGKTDSPGWHQLPPPKTGTRLSDLRSLLQGLLEKMQAQGKGTKISVDDIQLMPVDKVMVAISCNMYDNSMELAAIDIDGMNKSNDVIASLRYKQCDDLRDQIDKALADQKKAKKGGIFGAILNWINTAVHAIIGVAKILVGNVVGGVADLVTAGALLVKSLMKTLALVDPNHKSTYDKVADIAGKIALFSELFSLGSAITGMGAGTGSKLMQGDGKFAKLLRGIDKNMTYLEAAKFTTFAVTPAAEQITSGVIDLNSAKTRKQIQDDINDSMFLQFLISQLDAKARDLQSEASDYMTEAANSMRRGNDSLNVLHQSQRLIINPI
ncbi:type III secretion system translocon subunit SctE [Paludibacterium sp. THUN1379]|uniref:type III secretion system translocon subunit SctE n=1 Tax=Paludibacterium sp. THUN1379 TaxID=3112107 RepID=UPI0030CF409E